ncbi:hypothetical protein OIU77_026994 [Salix suchowensis]|uniref:Uncharacterized protein n=1 Tax=Salix suchowensis TaxID=1278906 RepID=A0ABQ9BN12_9ROSI|nr:hypothetical protein OIU77_026994 [Salix suchowensis]
MEEHGRKTTRGPYEEMLSRTAGCREEQGKVYARNGSGKNLMKKRGRSGTPEQMKPWKHIRRNWGRTANL